MRACMDIDDGADTEILSATLRQAHLRKLIFTLVIMNYQLRLLPHVNFVVVEGVVRYHEWSYVQKGSSRGLWFWF